ncbi:MAG: NAD(P)-dependent oxidoreductase [Candidatus Kapaibacterium sp.]|nr:MAG: NAD(P)-dependent oxidoreductase [Candidatus Kapabacteria bacterium]
MQILLTGGSSLTGMWFAEELACAGHSVTAVLTRSNAASYTEEPRNRRVERLLGSAEPLWNCRFGDDGFLAALDSSRFDVLCHHGADVTNYKSPDFKPVPALAANTDNIVGVLNVLGKRPLVLSGSVFERGEGVSSGSGDAVSPYGLSKWLTSELVRFYAAKHGVPLGKFVIPNPFGPFEEARFTRYMIREWFAGKAPNVSTPLYVRDNIPVSLLAKAYRVFVERCAANAANKGLVEMLRLNPSGYVESQGTFAERLATELRPRLNLPCEFQLGTQTDFSEPMLRVNTDNARLLCPEWSEAQAWDEFAAYYQSQRQSF